MSPLLQSLKSGFDALPPALRDDGALAASRRAALQAALAHGLPGPRAEAWRYTSLRALERREFAVPDAVPSIDPAELAGVPEPRLVFVNGRVSAQLSDFRSLPDGVRLSPLSQELSAGEARAVNFLQRRFEGGDAVFAQFNAALAAEGAVLRVESGVRVEPVLHIVQIGTAAGADQAWHLRHLIELRERAQLRIIEHQLGIGPHANLCNALMHVHLQSGARLTHLRLQQDAAGAVHLLRTDAALAGDSEYRRLDLELGGGLVRHELNVELQGEGAQLFGNGVLLADARRQLDTRLDVQHIAPGSSADLLWRGLAAGRSRAAFRGRVLIRAGADRTQAALSNKNLLLSDGAEIDTQPVMEIHADEVKAAHGATVGRLDPDALFYLRTRGLPVRDARRLLIGGFCREPLRLVDAPLRDAADVALLQALLRLEEVQ